LKTSEKIPPVVINGNDTQTDEQDANQTDNVKTINVDDQESIGKESIPLVLSRQEYLTDFLQN